RWGPESLSNVIARNMINDGFKPVSRTEEGMGEFSALVYKNSDDDKGDILWFRVG
ncbi:hypothetical protein LCGC14_2039280, partial [marine sediment metagenome]